MVGVTSLGVGSGLDLQSLVDGLVAAESQLRLGSLAVREASATERLSAYGLLSSALSEFDSSLSALADISNFEERNVSTTNSDAFSVSANLDAPLGSFDIEVLSAGTSNLLTATGLVDITGAAITSSATNIGGGTLTIQQGTQTAFTVDISSSSSSLAEIAQAINSADGNTGVSASAVTGDSGTVLVLSADEVGVDNAITVTVDDVDGDDVNNLGLSQLAFASGVTPRFAETTAATNAQISVSGQTVTSTSGATFSNVISGVSIEALEETTQVESFSISKTTAKATAAVEEFVVSYNALFESINELGRAGSEDIDGGTLVGDSVLRNLSSQIRRTLFTSFESSLPVGVRSLSDIGINIDRDGVLSLDSSKLNTALDTSFQSVVSLFSSSGEGVAQTQEYQSISYADLATEPGDITFNFSTGSGETAESFSVNVNGLDLVATRDAINSAGDNFGVTASVILEDDGGGGTQARLILSADTKGQSFSIDAVDNVSSNSLSIFSLSAAAEVSSPTGIVALLESISDGYLGVGSTTGIIQSRTEGLNTEVDRIQDQRLNQQRRLEDFEARLVRQFASLDLLVSNLQSSGDFLLSQLNSISQISSNNSSSN